MKMLIEQFLKGKGLIVFLFILLVIRAIFYSTLINIAHIPDLGYHIAVSDIYRQNPFTIFFWNINDISICSKGIGVLSSFLLNPFLYHSFIGKIWYLFERIGFSNAYQMINLVQSFMGILTIYYIYLIAKLLTKDKLVHILTILLASSIPMFSFIMHYLTYDNLTNLLSAAATYYLLKYFRKEQPRDLILLLIILMLGSLTKDTFLPFGIILFLLILIHYKLILITKILRAVRLTIRSVNALYLLLFVFTAIIFFLYFARNIIIYKKILPASASIKMTSCTVNRAKIKEVNTINSKLEFDELQQHTKRIGTLTIAKSPMGIIEYFSRWQATIQWSIFNISSHRTLEKKGIINKSYNFFVFIFLIASVWQLFKKNKYVFYLLFIFTGYTTFYFIYMYIEHTQTLLFGPAIQGRYLFPVLSAFIVPASYSLMKITKNKFIRIIMFIVIAVFFIYFDFFWFLKHYQVWYALPPLDLPK